MFVGYTDFLVARQSRDHWKSKAERWEAEAKSQERCIQNVENLLVEAHKESEALRADIKRLTSIIDLNTDDKGRDLVALTQRNGELIQMLAHINDLSFKAISR
jgi:predicted RNase H-like nuclease (RuvC/YqgF family)